MNNFGSAIKRTVAGAFGLWCIVGPVILLYALSQGEGSVGLIIPLSVFLSLCYAIVGWLWWRKGFTIVRSLMFDALLSICFAIVGGIPIGLWNAFTGIRPPNLTIMAFIIVCFWFLETMRARTPTT
jgi:hypothetical protein